MAATDPFSASQTDPSVTIPAVHAFSITGNDGSDLTFVTRGLYVGAAGDVKIDMLGGETVTFSSLSAGVIHPIRAKRVYSTGTTATGILGVY